MSLFWWVVVGWLICIIGMVATFRSAGRAPVPTPIYVDDQEMAVLLADLHDLPTTPEGDQR